MFQTSILMRFFWSCKVDLFSGNKTKGGFNFSNFSCTSFYAVKNNNNIDLTNPKSGPPDYKS